MHLTRVVGLVALTALVLNCLQAPVSAQTEWPNCENFRNQDDAQAAYDADRGDPFDLESSEPVNDVPCEDDPDFGADPPVSCDALTQYPNAQQALQGLYDHTRGEGDPYGLDQGGDPAIACDGGGGRGNDQEELDGPAPESDQEDLDGPPPDRGQVDSEVLDGAPPVTSGGTNVVVSVTPLDDFGDLEARLNARFTELVAEFAAFEARAENGFGMFEESANDAASDGQGGTVVLTAAQLSSMAPTRNPDTRIQAVLTQGVRNGESIGADPSTRLKARKDSKRKLEKNRKTGKRDRHNGKHRNRH